MRRKLAARPLLIAIVTAFSLITAPAIAEAPLPIGPSVSYTQIYLPEGPWAIHVAEADLSEPYLELKAVLGAGNTMGRRPLTQMLASVASEESRPVAGVNADYFALAGNAYTTVPLGFHVSGGELVTFPSPARSVLYQLADGTIGIDRFRSNSWLVGPGDLLFPLAGINRPPEYSDLVLFTPRFGQETRTREAATQFQLAELSGEIRPNTEITARIAGKRVAAAETIPAGGAVLAARGVAAYALRDLEVGDEITLRLCILPEVGELRLAVGGGPRLLREGKLSVENKLERFSDSFDTARHPRTGVGVRDRRVVLVAVDGRQPGYSHGMTLDEFARLFAELGCSDAMNLDGGGSTTMVVRDRLVNSPSGGAQRAVANALALFTTSPVGPPIRLALAPAETSVLSGVSIRLSPTGVDQYYNPVTVDPKTVDWRPSAGLGVVDENGVFTAAQVSAPTVGMVLAHSGDLTASVVLTVLPQPARLALIPASASLDPGGKQKFLLRAYDDRGRLMVLPEGRIEWSCEPPGRMGSDGVLTAPPRAARLTVVARVGAAQAQAEVMVGGPETVVEDFEGEARWSFGTAPAGLPGSASAVEDPSNKANHCLRLSYDFSQSGGTRAAYAILNVRLPDTPTFSLRARGEGEAAWLRAQLSDGVGRRFTADFEGQMDWSGKWRTLRALIPHDSMPPVTLESIYVSEYHDERRPVGSVSLDDIAVVPLGESSESPRQEEGTRAPVDQDSDRAAKEEKPVSELPTYVCRRTPEPITVDGHFNEPVWSRALPVGDFLFIDGVGEPQLPTELRLCWDDENLYLAFTAIDTDIWGKLRNRDDPVWSEEVVEAFISSGGDITRYYEFNVSPHNVVFDAAIQCPESGDRKFMKANVGWNCEGLQSAVQVVGTLDVRTDLDEYWTVELALPFTQIGRSKRPPEEGERWRSNFYRIDRAGEGEFSCWSPTLADPPNFHVPGRFGNLVFSTEAW